ncbi:MAG: DUF4167 domain-containing protein [Pseudomonadota bacterium]
MVKSMPQSASRPSGTKRTNETRTKRAPFIPGSRRLGPKDFTSNQKRYEHYMSRARDAASIGDVIEAENLYQHAEHYLRKMRE